MSRFRVMMTIDGIEVPSSCVFTGTRTRCEACKSRLMRGARHPSVGFVVLECCT